MNLIGQAKNARHRADARHQFFPHNFVTFMGLTYVAAGYPMVRLVESDFPDSPSPTIVHHQYEPVLTISQEILHNKDELHNKTDLVNPVNPCY